MPTNPDQSELIMTAYRYCSDDMTVDERVEFEALLSHDQSAQDALVDVVRIEESLLAISQERLESSSNLVNRTQPIAVHHSQAVAGTRQRLPSILAVSVSTVVILTMLISRSPDGSNSNVDPTTDVDKIEVVSLWSQMSEGDNSEDSEFQIADGFDEFADVSHSFELTVPEWMFAAVEISSIEDDMDMMDPETLDEEFDEETL